MEGKIDLLRFNAILHEEMSKSFPLTPLPLDPDFSLKHSERSDGAYIKSDLYGCGKTGGIRCGEMIFDTSMAVNFGSVPPAEDFDFPVFGFTFVLAERFLICVLDLHPVARTAEYLEKYIAPLRPVAEKYRWIPKTEGGRSEVHEWAKAYDSGHSLYRWCDGEHLAAVEEAFRGYVSVFCDCVKKAAPVTDPAARAQKEAYMTSYRHDYAYKDPGSNPLKHHFGEQWGDRYMTQFLFGP